MTTSIPLYIDSKRFLSRAALLTRMISGQLSTPL